MAVLKFISAIHPWSSSGAGRFAGLKKCIDYIQNPAKTEGGKYTGAQGCIKDYALQEMIDTMEGYGKDTKSKDSRLAYHWTISFKKNDKNVDADKALEIAREFCESVLDGFEAVYSVHTDKKHLHCHIVFNATNYKTGIKFHYKNGDWKKKQQPNLDKICKKHGVNTLTEDTGISLEEYEEDRKKRAGQNKSAKRRNNRKYHREEGEKFSWNSFIKNDIDELILTSANFEELLMGLRDRGYTVKEKNVKHIAVKAPGMDAYRRLDSIDKANGYYSPEDISRRIRNRVKAQKNRRVYEKPIDEGMKYIIPYKYRIYYFRSQKGFTDTRKKEVQKKYYSRMYRLGIKKKQYKINYGEVREALREIEKTRNKLEMLSGWDNLDECKKQQAAYIKSIEKIETDIKLLREERQTCRLLIEASDTIDKNTPYEKRHDAGDMSLAEYKEENNKLREYLKSFGYTKEEAAQLKNKIKEGIKELKKRKREAEKNLSLLDEMEAEINTPPTREDEKIFAFLKQEEEKLKEQAERISAQKENINMPLDRQTGGRNKR